MIILWSGQLCHNHTSLLEQLMAGAGDSWSHCGLGHYVAIILPYRDDSGCSS